ncbi:putative restriction alleviation protein [Paracoccus phage vB_PmaP_KLEP18-1]|nr:putative restriction alleviation protein [Paracoccus phage vB_PmaP_KLEP18-1]
MTERLTDEALLPCPFCGCRFCAAGYDSDMRALDRENCITVRCRQCGNETAKFSSERAAIAAWNRRATPADDLRAELEWYADDLRAENERLRGVNENLHKVIKEHHATVRDLMDRAALSHPAPAPQPADDLPEKRAKVRASLEDAIGWDAYDCTRVWDAWSVGTMSADDFEPVLDRLDEITDAVVAALSQNGGAA